MVGIFGRAKLFLVIVAAEIREEFSKYLAEKVDKSNLIAFIVRGLWDSSLISMAVHFTISNFT
jgi:hypothetical protein